MALLQSADFVLILTFEFTLGMVKALIEYIFTNWCLMYFKELLSWSQKPRVTPPNKQASMHAPRFDAQSKQSSKQPY